MSRIQILVPTIALAVFACGGTSDPSSPADSENDPAASAVASIVLDGAVVMLWDTGVGTRLTAAAVDSRGHPVQDVIFHWTSEDPSVATVDDGEVRATGDGWTEVTASAGGASESVSIVVATPDSPKDRTDCIACHADAYLGKHGGSSTPETCLQCHAGRTWTGGDFDHTAVSNGFDLLGVHAVLSCTACHQADGTPKYPGVGDNQCVACHQSDYDGQHGGSGTPTTCLHCHTRDEWTGADFDHDAQFFPISVGKHQGKWSGCTTCHTDSSDYSNFTCFACHPHDQSRMDDKHSDVSGYAYDSDRCYACHPTGQGD